MSLHNGHIEPRIKRGWARALLLFVVYLLIYVAVGLGIAIVVANVSGKHPDDNNIPYLWITASSILSVAAVLLFRKFIDRRSLNSIGLALSRFFPDGVIGFFYGVFLVCAGAVIIFELKSIEWTDILLGRNIVPSLFMLLLAALSEELVFRGYILRHLAKSFHPWVALAVSSGLFALVHGMNPGAPAIGILNVLLGGGLLGLAYLKTRGLWMPVLFHFSWNFFQGPVLGFPVSGLAFKPILSTTISGSELINGGSFGFEGSVVCTSLLLITFLLFFFSKRWT